MTFDLEPGALLDIAEVSRITGVSSRTLRHYDDIGLLAPARTRSDGRRSYGRTELLRLQRILILRRLDLPLERIARILDDETDEVAALTEHLVQLEERRSGLDAVIATVRRTLDHLTKGSTMTAADAFADLPGYDPDLQARYESEARERWGDDAVDSSRRRTSAMEPDQAREAMAEHDAIARGVAEAAAAGVPADDPRVLSLVARHHAWLGLFWDADAEAYEGLAALYVEDERFRATYDAFGPGTADLLSTAMRLHAADVLRITPE